MLLVHKLPQNSDSENSEAQFYVSQCIPQGDAHKPEKSQLFEGNDFSEH